MFDNQLMSDMEVQTVIEYFSSACILFWNGIVALNELIHMNDVVLQGEWTFLLKHLIVGTQPS